MNRQAPKNQRPNTRSLAPPSLRDTKNEQPTGKGLIIKPLEKKVKKTTSVPKVAIHN